MIDDHSTETRDSQLAELENDLQDLASDVQSLAEDVADSSRLVRDETVGAELLAGREVVAQVGIAFELAESLQALAMRQSGLLASDFRTTFEALFDPANRGREGAVLAEHVERRCRHLLDGWNEGWGLVASGLAASGRSAAGLWTPFAAVVQRDWVGRSEGRRTGS